MGMISRVGRGNKEDMLYKISLKDRTNSWYNRKA
jgi:hypothetical protein